LILLIDNYDSFSYNLYQYIGEINPDIKVIRNDEMSVDEIKELAPDKIIISPGPGRPENAGIIIDLIKELAGKIDILGICLGHQAICMAFGGVVTYAKKMMHGKQSLVEADTNVSIFKDCDKEMMVARYHSLAVDEKTIPTCLKVIAKTDDGEIMAVKHTDFNVYGLQFHPESIMTPDGKKMLANFIA